MSKISQTMSGVFVLINNCAWTTFAWINNSSGTFSGFVSIFGIVYPLKQNYLKSCFNTYFFSSRVLQMSFQTLVTNNQTSGWIEICPVFLFSSASKLNRKHVSCLYNSSTKGSNFLTCCEFLFNAFLVICPSL